MTSLSDSQHSDNQHLIWRNVTRPPFQDQTVYVTFEETKSTYKEAKHNGKTWVSLEGKIIKPKFWAKIPSFLDSSIGEALESKVKKNISLNVPVRGKLVPAVVYRNLKGNLVFDAPDHLKGDVIDKKYTDGVLFNAADATTFPLIGTDCLVRFHIADINVETHLVHYNIDNGWTFSYFPTNKMPEIIGWKPMEEISFDSQTNKYLTKNNMWIPCSQKLPASDCMVLVLLEDALNSIPTRQHRLIYYGYHGNNEPGCRHEWKVRTFPKQIDVPFNGFSEASHFLFDTQIISWRLYPGESKSPRDPDQPKQGSLNKKSEDFSLLKQSQNEQQNQSESHFDAVSLPGMSDQPTNLKIDVQAPIQKAQLTAFDQISFSSQSSQSTDSGSFISSTGLEHSHQSSQSLTGIASPTVLGSPASQELPSDFDSPPSTGRESRIGHRPSIRRHSFSGTALVLHPDDEEISPPEKKIIPKGKEALTEDAESTEVIARKIKFFAGEMDTESFHLQVTILEKRLKTQNQQVSQQQQQILQAQQVLPSPPPATKQKKSFKCTIL